jgi:hypothetical protein
MSKHIPAIVSLCLALGLHAVALAGTFAQPGGNRAYDRGHVAIQPGGAMRVQVSVANDAGKTVDNFEVRIPVSGAILDHDGSQIAASVPAAIANARASLLSAIDAAIDNAAAAGRFAR